MRISDWSSDVCSSDLPHLEELVEVLAEDGEELGPLEQRHLGVLGQRQDPGVEVEPGELAVQVARWLGAGDRICNGSIVPVPWSGTAGRRVTAVRPQGDGGDRKSVVEGKRGSVGVD